MPRPLSFLIIFIMDIDQLQAARPLTVLTGFLGSGKTTLLGHLLGGEHGMKIAVIMNEFGSGSSMERAVSVGSNAQDEWLDMANGCLCCSGVDKGLRALSDLLLRRPDIDWVVLEASGDADPAGLVRRLWAEPGQGLGVYLDAVVCLVDASRPHLYDQDHQGHRAEAIKQAALADLLVVNKIDLVSQPDLHAIDGLLGRLSPGAKRIKTERSSIPLTHIVNLRAYDTRFSCMAGEQALDLLALPSHPADQPRIRPIQLMVRDRAIEFGALEDWLFSLIWEGRIPLGEASGNMHIDLLVYRVKGLTFDGVNMRHVQAVEEIYEARPVHSLPSDYDNPRGTTLLVTGPFDAGQIESIRWSFSALFRR